MATSCWGEVAAANEVSQVTIEIDDDPAIGTFEQPSIAAPACSKVTAPRGATRRADEVTLAINVTDAFVAAVPGDVVNRVVLGLGVCASVVYADTCGLTEMSVAVILVVSTAVELLNLAV